MTILLADLVARRRQIVEMITAEGQRERRLSDKRLIKSIARLRNAELDSEIDDHMRDRSQVRSRSLPHRCSA